MKLFLFTSVLSGGGAERVLCELANRFVKDNEVTMIAAYPSSNEYYLDSDIEKIYIDSDPENKNSFRQIIRLRKLIKKNKPDVCISFLPQPNFKMLIASAMLKVKRVISVRNDPDKEYAGIINRLMAKMLYPLADGVVFQTREAQTWFSGAIQKKSTIIFNQVDEKFYSTARIAESYFIATGRLNKQKNYTLMVSVFAKIIREFPDEHLRIYGSGTEEKALSVLIKQLNAEKNIHLMGNTNDIPSVLAEAKGFLLTSDYEGMPNGLLEAMAMGLPCISTACPCGGPAAVISDRESGVLIPVGDEEKLYDELKALIVNETLRKKYGENAKKDAEKFDPDKVFTQWKEYIFSVV